MAEFERKLIRQRCDDGIKRAKAKGTVFGRPSVLDAGDRKRIAERYASGETMGTPRCTQLVDPPCHFEM
jgi:DNA invertase Pin-like site-specific DNA recombinase